MWVKYLIYSVLSRFQICRNLRVFFRQICIPKISEFTKKRFFPSLLQQCAVFIIPSVPVGVRVPEVCILYLISLHCVVSILPVYVKLWVAEVSCLIQALLSLLDPKDLYTLNILSKSLPSILELTLSIL